MDKHGTVEVGGELFYWRKSNKMMPTARAFCRNCGKESAKPVHAIYMNGRDAYGLRCEKCGSEYPMYESTYVSRYVGHRTSGGGFVNATHGQMSRLNAMDRRARQEYRNIPKIVEESMCNMLNMTHEEYRDMIKRRDENNARMQKAINAQKADRQAQRRDEKIDEQSNNRKELIAKGVLKYVKNVGLVNTETRQVVKV